MGKVHKIEPTVASWDWKVQAKGARGKTRKSVSPKDKIDAYYSMGPVPHSGWWRFQVPIRLSGTYHVKADQVGAGGRQSVVRISVLSELRFRDWHTTGSAVVFERRVTKATETGPLTLEYMSINDAHLQAPITSQEAIDWGDFSLRLRVELYAFAKWHGTSADLDLAGASAGIHFGPCTATVGKPEPRPGEDKL